jgi:hypothetical protein
MTNGSQAGRRPQAGPGHAAASVAETARSTVRAVELPEFARRVSTLSRIDYADCFVLDAGPDVELTGEKWAREMLEGAPERLRSSLRRGWFALGLRLGSVRSPDHVLGWEVRQNNDEYALLGATSRIGMPAELLFVGRPDGLLFATLVGHHNHLARAVWKRITPLHERVVRGALERAGRAARRARC